MHCCAARQAAAAAASAQSVHVPVHQLPARQLRFAAPDLEIRSDVEPEDLLRATGNLTLPAQADDNGHTQRMVALLVDGLRYGIRTQETR
jgi:hypothetical protein